jgi:RNA polymerase-binding transcription factor DksA
MGQDSPEAAMAGSKSTGSKSGGREAVKAKPDPKKAAPPAKKAEKPSAKPAPKPAAKGKGDSSGVRQAAKPAPSAKLAAVAKPAPAAPKVIVASSPFSHTELKEWRQVLLERRAEIATDINHLEKDAMEAEDGHTTPNHIAERGSDAEMQDMSLGLAGEEQAVLWQIDRAIRKIDTGEPLAFGICEHTRAPISKNRLQLIPWTPLSIEGATYAEEQGLALEDVLVDG